MSGPVLPDEARKAVNAAFEALSSWRTDIVNNSEKNSEKVVEKMAAAAQALGWPEQIVEATRAQIQSITKLQIQTMDQIMDAWEEQIKSPNPSAILPKLKSLPSLGSIGDWYKPDALQAAVGNPLGFYMQFAGQCQKAWADAMGLWLKAGKS
jgi:hypothetical protein